jgi:hypothetical protein
MEILFGIALFLGTIYLGVTHPRFGKVLLIIVGMLALAAAVVAFVAHRTTQNEREREELSKILISEPYPKNWTGCLGGKIGYFPHRRSRDETDSPHSYSSLQKQSRI